MLSGTSQAPPQLDEFFSAGEAPLREAEFDALGLTEQSVWPSFSRAREKVGRRSRVG